MSSEAQVVLGIWAVFLAALMLVVLFSFKKPQ